MVLQALGIMMMVVVVDELSQAHPSWHGHGMYSQGGSLQPSGKGGASQCPTGRPKKHPSPKAQPAVQHMGLAGWASIGLEPACKQSERKRSEQNDRR